MNAYDNIEAAARDLDPNSGSAFAWNTKPGLFRTNGHLVSTWDCMLSGDCGTGVNLVTDKRQSSESSALLLSTTMVLSGSSDSKIAFTTTYCFHPPAQKFAHPYRPTAIPLHRTTSTSGLQLKVA
ncbi:hypothetical protein LIA77_01801 [Sarocladium implicatum]|nr:hypothetical protein LIA77_01801 [Sarocladium implicatum]